jgi:hypothetical protein
VDRRRALHFAERHLMAWVRPDLTTAGERDCSPILCKLNELRMLILHAHEEAVGATARIDYDHDDGEWVP